MKASKRLKPIKKLAENKQKMAAQSLAKSIQQYKQQQQQLKQLQQYKAEYLHSMPLKSQQKMSGSQLNRYTLFLAKLELAIEQQQLAFQQSSDNLTLSRTQWQSDNGRASAINKAIDKLKTKENKEKDKKEVSQNDEMSTQNFLRKKGSLN